MEIAPQIFTAKVMHKRFFPKENQFTYGVYYVALPLQQLDRISIRGITSFHSKDHGARDGSDLHGWLTNILAEYGLRETVSHTMLIAMPRIFGYVFNPVSFWLCFDDQKQLRAVLCEVNNTFGETHSYLCAHADHRPINADDWLEADKVFHVSPFLKREGRYKFRFSVQGQKLGIWIDFFDGESNKQLITALTGTLAPLSSSSLRLAFFKHPLVTLKAIALIHFQAIKLMRNGIEYIRKPKQLTPKKTATSELTKM